MNGPTTPAAATLSRVASWLAHHADTIICTCAALFGVTVIFDLALSTWLVPALLLGLPGLTMGFALGAHKNLPCHRCEQLRADEPTDDEVGGWLMLRHGTIAATMFAALFVLIGLSVSYVLHTFTHAGRFLTFLPTEVAATACVVFAAALARASVVHRAFADRCRRCNTWRPRSA